MNMDTSTRAQNPEGFVLSPNLRSALDEATRLIKEHYSLKTLEWSINPHSGNIDVTSDQKTGDSKKARSSTPTPKSRLQNTIDTILILQHLTDEHALDEIDVLQAIRRCAPDVVAALDLTATLHDPISHPFPALSIDHLQSLADLFKEIPLCGAETDPSQKTLTLMLPRNIDINSVQELLRNIDTDNFSYDKTKKQAREALPAHTAHFLKSRKKPQLLQDAIAGLKQGDAAQPKHIIAINLPKKTPSIDRDDIRRGFSTTPDTKSANTKTIPKSTDNSEPYVLPPFLKQFIDQATERLKTAFDDQSLDYTFDPNTGGVEAKSDNADTAKTLQNAIDNILILDGAALTESLNDETVFAQTLLLASTALPKISDQISSNLERNSLSYTFDPSQHKKYDTLATRLNTIPLCHVTVKEDSLEIILPQNISREAFLKILSKPEGTISDNIIKSILPPTLLPFLGTRQSQASSKKNKTQAYKPYKPNLNGADITPLLTYLSRHSDMPLNRELQKAGIVPMQKGANKQSDWQFYVRHTGKGKINEKTKAFLEEPLFTLVQAFTQCLETQSGIPNDFGLAILYPKDYAHTKQASTATITTVKAASPALEKLYSDINALTEGKGVVSLSTAGAVYTPNTPSATLKKPLDKLLKEASIAHTFGALNPERFLQHIKIAIAQDQFDNRWFTASVTLPDALKNVLSPLTQKYQSVFAIHPDSLACTSSAHLTHIASLIRKTKDELQQIDKTIETIQNSICATTDLHAQYSDDTPAEGEDSTSISGLQQELDAQKTKKEIKINTLIETIKAQLADAPAPPEPPKTLLEHQANLNLKNLSKSSLQNLSGALNNLEKTFPILISHTNTPTEDATTTYDLTLQVHCFDQQTKEAIQENWSNFVTAWENSQTNINALFEEHITHKLVPPVQAKLPDSYVAAAFRRNIQNNIDNRETHKSPYVFNAKDYSETEKGFIKRLGSDEALAQAFMDALATNHIGCTGIHAEKGRTSLDLWLPVFATPHSGANGADKKTKTATLDAISRLSKLDENTLTPDTLESHWAESLEIAKQSILSTSARASKTAPSQIDQALYTALTDKDKADTYMTDADLFKIIHAVCEADKYKTCSLAKVYQHIRTIEAYQSLDPEMHGDILPTLSTRLNDLLKDQHWGRKITTHKDALHMFKRVERQTDVKLDFKVFSLKRNSTAALPEGTDAARELKRITALQDQIHGQRAQDSKAGVDFVLIPQNWDHERLGIAPLYIECGKCFQHGSDIDDDHIGDVFSVQYTRDPSKGQDSYSIGKNKSLEERKKAAEEKRRQKIKNDLEKSQREKKKAERGEKEKTPEEQALDRLFAARSKKDNPEPVVGGESSALGGRELLKDLTGHDWYEMEMKPDNASDNGTDEKPPSNTEEIPAAILKRMNKGKPSSQAPEGKKPIEVSETAKQSATEDAIENIRGIIIGAFTKAAGEDAPQIKIARNGDKMEITVFCPMPLYSTFTKASQTLFEQFDPRTYTITRKDPKDFTP